MSYFPAILSIMVAIFACHCLQDAKVRIKIDKRKFSLLISQKMIVRIYKHIQEYVPTSEETVDPPAQDSSLAEWKQSGLRTYVNASS